MKPIDLTLILVRVRALAILFCLATSLVQCSSTSQQSGNARYARGQSTTRSGLDPRLAQSGPQAQLASVSAQPYPIPDRPLAISSSAPPNRAESYILIDARTGAHLASRNPDQHRAVASTQKLITALVVLDSGNLDQRIQIQASDTQVEPTKLGFRPGESYTRRELLYAFLIRSSNDVAKALARDNAGSSAAFAERMNWKMQQLGATPSRFTNPHGLTEPGQFSTARNMAKVAMAAYRHRFIRDAVCKKYYSFRFNNGRTVTLKNTNDLLGVMPECNGMKTGYTVASGRCLISSASRGGRHVILVQLGSKSSYIFNDAHVMMNWGLNQLERQSPVFAARSSTPPPVFAAASAF